jgi:hypothetical protein
VPDTTYKRPSGAELKSKLSQGDIMNDPGGGIRRALLACALGTLVACGAPADEGADAPPVPGADSGAAVPDSTATAPDSASFTTVRGETDLIRVDSPLPGELVTSPLTIRGRARGNWFFEGTFPVILTNWDGLIIAQHYATARGEWMTTEFVPFEAVIEFEIPPYVGDFSRRGSLILQKNNPSGLPQFDDALEFTVFFPTPAPQTSSAPSPPSAK